MPRFVCFENINDALPLWHEHEKPVHGVAQSALWTRLWQQNVNQDCVVLAMLIADRPVLLLPLEIIGQGNSKTARFIGGSHANCNFPVLFAPSTGQISPAHITSLIDCLKSARPDIADIALTRQVENWLGFTNPLLTLPHQLNPNPLLMASLPQDFDTILARGNAKRKRKKHRSHERRYEEAGGWRLVTPNTVHDNIAAFDAFLAMKSQRFTQQGIKNSFAEKGIQPFFQALFSDADNRANRQYQLHVLEVANTPRAILGCSTWHYQADDNAPPLQGMTAEFAAFADDELVTASPGDFLFYETIAAAIAERLDYFSFGIGDEAYKRDWCDIEAPLYDSYIGLTLSGRFKAKANNMRSQLLAHIKGNPQLWKLVKKLRQKF